MNNHSQIAFIGGGNMASSIIGGLISAGTDASQLHVADPNQAQRKKLQRQFITNVYASNKQAASKADVIVVATKPQICQRAIESIKAILADKCPLVISVVAGIRIDNMQRWSDSTLPIIRIMPNTPTLIGEGLSALYANALCKEEQKQFSDKLMQGIGQTIWVSNEDALDIVTGVSGSGPAYYFKLMEVMIRVAENQGINPGDAKKMVLQTALGAARLAMDSPYSPRELRKQVTSPGGTTQAAITKMGQSGIDHIIELGILAAIDRSKELTTPKEN